MEHVEGFGEWRGVVALGLPKKLNLVILIVVNLKILGMDVMRRKIFDMSFSSVYPHYLVKVQKKGKTQDELNYIIRWLTGYNAEELTKQIASNDSFESFFNNAPELNPKRKLIKGVICGVRVEEIDQPLMQEIRYLDKLVDELAKGKKMSSILRH